MKKFLIITCIVLALALIAVIAFFVIPKLMDNSVSNTEAEQDKKNRYITVVNDTDAVINKLTVCVDGNVEIEEAKITDYATLDKKSISIKIPNAYDEYNEFTVILVDRYEKIYEKTVLDVPLNDRTTVVISKDDYVEQPGDWLKNLFGFFNGD